MWFLNRSTSLSCFDFISTKRTSSSLFIWSKLGRSNLPPFPISINSLSILFSWSPTALYSLNSSRFSMNGMISFFNCFSYGKKKKKKTHQIRLENIIISCFITVCGRNSNKLYKKKKKQKLSLYNNEILRK